MRMTSRPRRPDGPAGQVEVTGEAEGTGGGMAHDQAPGRTRSGGNPLGRLQPHQPLRHPAAAPALPVPGGGFNPVPAGAAPASPLGRWVTKLLSMEPGGHRLPG